MRRIRKILFWTHLIGGCGAGVIILIMCLSGVLLAFEESITIWADGHRSNSTSSVAPHASIDELLGRASVAEPTVAPSNLILRSDPSLPIAVTFGREKTLLFDPASGESLGEGARGVRAAFRFIIEWHRWLGRPESSRDSGRAITGASNAVFLFLVLSGIVLWFPRKWNLGSVRSALVFNFAARGRARDWNWHNVFGFWCFIPLAVIVATGVIMSYPWANRLLFRMAGSEPPAARRPETNTAQKKSSDSRSESKPAPWKIEGFDGALALVKKEFPEWKAIRARFAPNGGPVTFSIDPVNGRPQQRSQMTVKLQTGEVVRVEPYSGFDRGRRWRLLARFLHTGEALGVFGQVIAALVSAGGAFLVWTGFSLAIRRFLGRKQRSSAPVLETVEEAR